MLAQCWVTSFSSNAAILIGQHTIAPALRHQHVSYQPPRRFAQALPSTTNSQPQRKGPKQRKSQGAYRRWRGMSKTYHATFGQQIFTDVSASGNSSGRDRFEMLDATQFYNDHLDYQVPGAMGLSEQDSSYAHGHPFAYASHNDPPSLPCKRLSYHVLSLRSISFTSSIAPR